MGKDNLEATVADLEKMMQALSAQLAEAKEELKKANEKKSVGNNQGLKDKIYASTVSLFLEIYPKVMEQRKSRSKRGAGSIFSAIESIAQATGEEIDVDELHGIVSKDKFLKNICFKSEDNPVVVRKIKNASKRTIDANDIAVILSDEMYSSLGDYDTLWVFGIDKLYYICGEKIGFSYSYDEIEDVKWQSNWGYIKIASYSDKEWNSANVGDFGLHDCRISGPSLLRDIIWEVIDIVKNYVEEPKTIESKEFSDISLIKDIKFDGNAVDSDGYI